MLGNCLSNATRNSRVLVRFKPESREVVDSNVDRNGRQLEHLALMPSSVMLDNLD